MWGKQSREGSRKLPVEEKEKTMWTGIDYMCRVGRCWFATWIRLVFPVKMQNLVKLVLEENEESLVLWVSVRWAYLDVHEWSFGDPFEVRNAKWSIGSIEWLGVHACNSGNEKRIAQFSQGGALYGKWNTGRKMYTVYGWVEGVITEKEPHVRMKESNWNDAP